MIVSDSELGSIKYIASARHNLHLGQSSSRPLSENYELIGLLGEFAFYKEFGTKPDWSLKSTGDGRIDFHVGNITIDVKTALKPYNLLREVYKKHADILVLASVSKDFKQVNLLGWEYDSEMIKQPIKDFGYGVINYYKPADSLRDIEELKILLGVNNVE
jgi:hypothetical protein